MRLLRAVAESIGARRPGVHLGLDEAGHGTAPHTFAGLQRPWFLEVEKTIAISHAEVSALYFVVEEFAATIADTDRGAAAEEARKLIELLRDVIRRWNTSAPEGVYADLFELPWEG